MKKFVKSISVLLTRVLIIALATVSVFAADAESIAVITPPTKTVYIDGVDNYETDIYCDPTGMVLEVTFSDGTTEFVTVDEYSYVDMIVYDYVIGENVMAISVMGVSEEFVVMVSSSDDNGDNGNNNNDNDDNINNDDSINDNNDNQNSGAGTLENPVIPNTDSGASVVAFAVMTIASGMGIAIIPNKKRK